MSYLSSTCNEHIFFLYFSSSSILYFVIIYLSSDYDVFLQMMSKERRIRVNIFAQCFKFHHIFWC